MLILAMQVVMMMDYELTSQLIAVVLGTLFMELLALIYKRYLMRVIPGLLLVEDGQVIVLI